MIRQFFYRALKIWVGIFFNLFNLILAGNLPPFGCVSVIVEARGRYLAVQRPQGHYVFPGGFMRWREHPVETALRECEEETGLQVQITGLIGCSSNVSDHIGRMSTLTAIYHAEVVGGNLRSSIEGKPMWLEETELQDKLFRLQVGILEHYLAKRAQQSHVASDRIPDAP